MNRTRSWFLVLLLAAPWVALPGGLPAVQAAEEARAAGARGPNVLITLTIGKTGAGAPTQRVYKLLGQDGSNARMLMGWRTPIPTVSAANEDPGASPVTSYTYQNLGVSADLRVAVLGAGRVALRGEIEVSGAREGPAAGAAGNKAPLIGTFQQYLEVVALEGKKLRVAEAPDPEGGTVSLDVEVDVLE